MRRASMGPSVLVCLLVAASAGPMRANAPFPPKPTLSDLSKVFVFEEPLVFSRTPSPQEVQALAKALGAYISQGHLEDLSPIQDYLKRNPASPWRLSLLVNVGLMHRHVGQVSTALGVWEEAWAFGKLLKDPASVALAHRALGELLEANAGLGHQERLEALVKEAEDRELSGLVTEKLSLARESLAYMETSPETAFRCGPVALVYLKAAEDPLALGGIGDSQGKLSTEKGTTLSMNWAWSVRMGLELQMAKRTPGAGVLLPSVLHFRTGHFAAALVQKGNRVLVQDPFLGDTWMPLTVLDHEASGYALVPAGPLPKGWSAVSKTQGETVWGKGAWGPGRPDDTRPDSYRIPSGMAPAASGLPHAGFHANLVSLHLEIPAVSYTPPKGPKVELSVAYNQREYGQPQIFDYCNLGPKWTFSYLACLKDDSTNPNFNVTLCNPGGGGLIFQSRGDGTFLPENYTQAQLVRQPGNTYMIQYLDGHKDYYEAADRIWGLRRLVLTRRQDASGNDLKFAWDAQLRLMVVMDADGQATTLSYEVPRDPLKLTKVTDPIGKATRFEYDSEGRLVRTINAQGVATTFSYGPTAADPAMPKDFIHGMESLSGPVRFREGETFIGASYRRWLESLDGSGRVERVEGGAGYAYEIDPEQLPKVPELDPAYHPLVVSFRESFYWLPGDYEARKPDFRKARHIRWGHGPGGFSSGIVLSEKEPDGPRHWYVHAGDFWGGIFPTARDRTYSRTPEGLPTQPGARTLVPVFDGNRKLVTRDYWTNPDGSLGKAQFEYDVKGRLVKTNP